MVGKINIIGDIGTFENVDGVEFSGVELVDVISQVRKQPNATSFDVYINSDGGVVDTGYDIFNYLKSLGLPIRTIGQGVVASIATVIFMAGSKRIVTSGTKFMIHLPMGGISFATAAEMENHSKVMRQTENEIIGFYSKHLNLSKEAITPLLRNETWLTENQLKDLGFVTSTSELKIAAKAIVKNKPKTKTMSKHNKFKAILNALVGTTVAKTIKTAEQGELSFPDLGEDDNIDLGQRAMLDGQPVGGTEDEPKRVVGADGFVYLFVDSLLTEKVEDVTEEDDITSDEMMDALVATLEVAAEMEGRLTALETETVALRAERDEFKTKLASAQSAIAKLKGASPEPEANTKDKPTASTKQTSASSAVAAWKAKKANQSKKTK